MGAGARRVTRPRGRAALRWVRSCARGTTVQLLAVRGASDCFFLPFSNALSLLVPFRHTSATLLGLPTNDFNLDIGEGAGATGRRQTGRAQDHGHDAQTAGRKIQRMIAAMTAHVGMVRIQDTRIFPSMTTLDVLAAERRQRDGRHGADLAVSGGDGLLLDRRLCGATPARHAIAAAAVQFHSQHRITR